MYGYRVDWVDRCNGPHRGWIDTRLRSTHDTEVKIMNTMYVIGIVVAAVLFGYLVYALIKAEDF